MSQDSPENAHAPVGSSTGAAPYISVVATARNDDHGGNLLGRMQIFVDTWVNQANLHQLPSELIIVEWNPPAERPRLTEALRWPDGGGFCTVRIIEVPRELHARYRHAKALPLYQMIAKNAGIRRARGEFVLATNIDIVFSSELVRFLASRPLVKGRMYRIDRHDVMSDVPANGTLDEQFAYCRDHVIRLCAREGTFRLTPEGFRQTEPDDIVPAGSQIYFGSGWYPPEQYGLGPKTRWTARSAVVYLLAPKGGAVLELEVEPGPGVLPGPERLQVLDRSGSCVGEWTIAGRTRLGLLVPEAPDGGMQEFCLSVPNGGRPTPGDPRILNLRFRRCAWVEPRAAAPPASAAAVLRDKRPLLTRLLAAGRRNRGLPSWASGRIAIFRKAVHLLAVTGSDVTGPGVVCWGKGWYDRECSGGECFRWASRDAALILRPSEPNPCLAMLVEPGPGLDFAPFVLQVRRADGAVVADIPVNGLTYVEIPLPLAQGTTVLFLNSDRGGTARGQDPRILNFRVFGLGFHRLCSPGGTPRIAGTVAWTAFSDQHEPPSLDWASALEHHRRTIEDFGKPEYLHSYACGDFTLLAREAWFDVRGYAELDQFSMHLDSILCYAAHHAGMREEVLPEPMRIYHIEHGVGSGWTPEGENEMYMRIARKGIPTVSYEHLVALIAQMRTVHAPVIFNMEDWGLAESTLAETVPTMGFDFRTR